MRLFNLDLHISVIADVRNIFQRLYPEIEITSWCLSRHTWVMGREQDSCDVINGKSYPKLGPELVQAFHKRYDSFLRQFDGFIVTFPPSFALLFEKYNKPIFLVNAIRYEAPFHFEYNKHLRKSLEERLLAMYKKGQLIAVSNNKGDRDYLKMGAGIESHHIPSLCLYTESFYTPQHADFIFTGKTELRDMSYMINMQSIRGISWSELYKFRGVVHMPYEISTMSTFEQYSANVPLFFPAKNALKQLIKAKAVKFHGALSRDNHYPPHVEEALGESWIDYWLDRADYYDQENMKYIQYFKDTAELHAKLKESNHALISQKMKVWNRHRQSEALSQWRELLKDHYKKPVFRVIKGNGQINLESDFGKELYKLAINPQYINYLEIGAWNGEGSTACIMNGLLKRDDESRLVSIEANPVLFEKARQFWSWIPESIYPYKLHLLNGSITRQRFLSRSEVEHHPAMKNPLPDLKTHYERDYDLEKETYESTPYVYSHLPTSLDVVILDGGEFSTYSEYEIIREHKNPKVFVLDDTRTIKCGDIREELLADPDWSLSYDDQNTRNGASIFVKSD